MYKINPDYDINYSSYINFIQRSTLTLGYSLDLLLILLLKLNSTLTTMGKIALTLTEKPSPIFIYKPSNNSKTKIQNNVGIVPNLNLTLIQPWKLILTFDIPKLVHSPNNPGLTITLTILLTLVLILEINVKLSQTLSTALTTTITLQNPNQNLFKALIWNLNLHIAWI